MLRHHMEYPYTLRTEIVVGTGKVLSALQMSARQAGPRRRTRGFTS